MKDHSVAKRGFHHLMSAWYGDACTEHADYVDSITMGFYHPDGGTTGEFSIKWFELSGRIVSQIMVFDDAWNALYEFRDVLEKLA